MKEQDLTAMLAEMTGGRPGGGGDWREYYHALRERFWILLLCLVLGAIGAALYMLRQETVFKARAVLFLEQEQNRVLEVKGVREEAIRSLDMINTIVDLLGSYGFAQRVTERLKLHEDPRFQPVVPLGEGRRFTADEAAATLASLVSSQYRKNTRLIDIFVIHPNPTLASSLATAYAEEYPRYVFEKRADANRGANQFLIDEAVNLKKKMRLSEEAMESFRQREQAPSFENLQETAQLKMAELTARISAMEQKYFQLDLDLKVVRSAPDNVEELLRLPSVATEPKIARYSEAIAEQERQIMQISQRYRAKHPEYKKVITQRDALLAERVSILRNVLTLLENEQRQYQTQLAELKKEHDAQHQFLLKISPKAVEYNHLKRELEADRVMYDSVMGRTKEIDLTKGISDSPVRVYETSTHAVQIAANPFKVYGVGLFLGLAAGVAAALGLNFLDSSVKTVEQAEQITGLPVLAAIAKKKSRNTPGALHLDVFANRAGPVAESFRSLRASVSMLADSDSKHIFLFTSAVPSEGKTFTSTNFAASLCQQGFRTLLIDADLRKPAISPLVFGEHRKPGLSDVLAGRIPLDEAIIPAEIENLSVLTAGSRAPDPAELLAAKRMRDLVAEAIQQYDRVVIDTAPALAVSDALLIAPYADVTCLVLRSCSTPRKSVARAVRSLAEIGCRPAGIILNFVPSGSGQDAFYYSGKTYGSYGAKGVYGADAKV